jgi:chromosome segregation ATPase
VLASDLKSS